MSISFSPIDKKFLPSYSVINKFEYICFRIDEKSHTHCVFGLEPFEGKELETFVSEESDINNIFIISFQVEEFNKMGKNLMTEIVQRMNNSDKSVKFKDFNSIKDIIEKECKEISYGIPLKSK